MAPSPVKYEPAASASIIKTTSIDTQMAMVRTSMSLKKVFTTPRHKSP